MRWKSCGSGATAALCLFLCAATTSGCLLLPDHHPSTEDVRGVAFLFAKGDRDMELRRYDEAAAAFQEASGRARRASLAKDERQTEWQEVSNSAQLQFAIAHEKAGNYEYAANVITWVISEADHPLKALAQLKRGGYLVKLGRIEDAKDEFRRVILDGQSPQYHDKIPAWLLKAAQEDFDRLK